LRRLEPTKIWLKAARCSRLLLSWATEVKTLKEASSSGLSRRLGLVHRLLELLRLLGLLRCKLLGSRLLWNGLLLLNDRLLLQGLRLCKPTTPVVTPIIVCGLSSDWLLPRASHIEEWSPILRRTKRLSLLRLLLLRGWLLLGSGGRSRLLLNS